MPVASNYGETPGYAEFVTWRKAFPERLSLEEHPGFVACVNFEACTVSF